MEKTMENNKQWKNQANQISENQICVPKKINTVTGCTCKEHPTNK